MNIIGTPATKDWPFYQKYMGKCEECFSIYFGPKRSPGCWECVSPECKQNWLAANKEKK